MDTKSQSKPGHCEDNPDGRLSGDRPFFRMAILLLLVGFLFVLHQDLSPFLIGLTLLAILVMVRKGIRFEAGVGVVVVLLFGAWLMGDMAGLLWPFVTSFVLAYLVSPLVGLMERWMSRTIAIALIVVVILGALSGIGIVVIPLVTQEIHDFGRRIPVYAAMLKQFYDQIFNWLQSIGVNLPKGQIQQLLLERLPKLGELFAEQTTAALKGLGSGLATLLNFLMIPFVTFYMIKDYDRIVRTVARVLPRRHAASIGEFLARGGRDSGSIPPRADAGLHLHCGAHCHRPHAVRDPIRGSAGTHGRALQPDSIHRNRGRIQRRVPRRVIGC